MPGEIELVDSDFITSLYRGDLRVARKVDHLLDSPAHWREAVDREGEAQAIENHYHLGKRTTQTVLRVRDLSERGNPTTEHWNTLLQPTTIDIIQPYNLDEQIYFLDLNFLGEEIHFLPHQ